MGGVIGVMLHSRKQSFVMNQTDQMKGWTEILVVKYLRSGCSLNLVRSVLITGRSLTGQVIWDTCYVKKTQNTPKLLAKLLVKTLDCKYEPMAILK